MGRTIYDKPVRALLRDMLADLGLMPGQLLTTERSIAWFKEHYPLIKRPTVVGHLLQASTNDKNRLHFNGVNASDDLLFKVSSNEFRLYVPGQDPAPIHELVEGDVARQEAMASDDEEEVVEAPVALGSSQFALEQDLQRYLADNLHIVEAGLTLYTEEGVTGLEVPAGGGRRIDILAIDKDGGFVVLELKVERGYDRVVGQLLRYMSYVRRELAEPGQRVRGIIVCRAMSDDLRMACESLPDVELFEYQLSVTVSRVPELPRR